MRSSPLIPVLLLTLLLTGAQTLGAEGQRLRFALAVGHNTGSSQTTPLRFAERDAAKMAELFSQLSQVPSTNVRLLVSPDREELERELAELRELFLAAAPVRVELFFYFSGHADDRGLQLGQTLFPLDQLQRFLADSGAEVTVAMVDACHSGALVRDKGGKRVPLVDFANAGEARGVAILTSSAATEKSQESDELRGSFFTHFISSGMRGDADSSGDGRVTLHELYQYAYNRTRRQTQSDGTVEQHPTFDYAITGSGELVVAFPLEHSCRLLLPAFVEGNFLLFSPATDSILAEVDKRAGEVRVLALPPGRLEVFRRTDRSLHKMSVSLAEGELTELPAGELVEVSRSYLLEKGERTYLSLAAKGGYQLFWDREVRERSLLPSVIGGLELRVANLLGPRVTPFVEFLAGGAAASSQGAASPLAQTFSCLEGGVGVAFTLISSPLLLELSPEVALYYAYLLVDDGPQAGAPNHYAMVSPSGSLLLGKKFGRSFTVALQAKAGYLYFRDSVSDFGEPARHLAFSEFFLSASLDL